MTKIVCNFEEVYNNCNKLDKYISEVKQDIIENQRQAESNLNWTGDAKTAFSGSLSNQTNVVNNDINLLEQRVNLMRKSAQEIERVENELSQIKL